MFLAELLGSMIVVLVILHIKDEIYQRDMNPIYYPLGATVAQVGVQVMFKNVSGGLCNPAVALSQITWQNLTYYYELGVDQSYWTPDYACCYILAPMVGAFMAGNLFGYQKKLYARIRHNLHESESSEEEDTKPKRKIMKIHRQRQNMLNQTQESSQVPQTQRSLLNQK